MSLKLMPGATVGIDLGTTYSTLAQIDKEGKPVAQMNADGKTITPSVVLLGDDGKVIVGPSFERIAVEDSTHVIEAIKREFDPLQQLARGRLPGVAPQPQAASSR